MPSDPVEQLRRVVEALETANKASCDFDRIAAFGVYWERVVRLDFPALLAAIDRLQMQRDEAERELDLVRHYDRGAAVFGMGDNRPEPQPAFDSGDWGNWRSWMNGWEEAAKLDRLQRIEAAAKAWADCRGRNDEENTAESLEELHTLAIHLERLVQP